MSTDVAPFMEIKAALWGLRRAFEKHHMTPAIVELADARQSLFLLSMIGPSEMLGMPTNGMDDKGRPMRQLEIEGVIVRWPARVISTGFNSFNYVD